MTIACGRHYQIPLAVQFWITSPALHERLVTWWINFQI